MKDLIVSVADSYQENVMGALLPRVPASSGTRQFTFDIIPNPQRDSGSYNISHELLRPYLNDYNFALVIFDYGGAGIENIKTREQAESDVEHLLSINGWSSRNSVIVIKPELENWMWVNSKHVQDAMDWEKNESLYAWARNEGYLLANESKPQRPKESLLEALKINGTSKSSSIYKKIATNVTYQKCEDPAFLKLLTRLKKWFPISQNI